MRAAIAPLIVALGFIASPALAQAPPQETPLNADLRSVDLGVRFGSVDGDEARFMRYRDLRDGLVLESGRYTREKDTRLFHAEVDHLGYRDQRLRADFERFGRVKTWFEWNQIPYENSYTTRTPFVAEGRGSLRIDDGVQQRIQSGAGTVANTLVPAANAFDLRIRRDIADMGATWHARPDLDLLVRVTTTKKSGEQPWGAGFGFSNDIEVAAPVETRTTDLGASAEWTRGGGLVRVGYDASWFSNDVPSLVWDNPLRASDAAGSPSQGRLALWPSSTTHTVSATGTVALPGRSRATAYVSRGAWLSDEPLLPHTINTAIASPALERPSSEAEAAVTATLLRFTSRPASWAWFNVNFRSYDFDNRTPPFAAPQRVNYDSALAAAVIPETEPLSYLRKYFEAEGVFTPWRRGAIRVGYGHESVDRTFRFFEETVDHSLRVSYDLANLSWATLRASYLHANRTGSGLDEEALSDIGEQVSLRQFDISDRVRDQGTLLVSIFPSALVSLNATIGGGQDDRPDAQFGLTDSSFGVYGAGADVTPREGVTFGLSYTFESFASLARSRQANPGAQFDDPTRDWSTDGDERVHSFDAGLELQSLLPRTDVRLGYDFTRSRATWIYGVPPNSTLTPPTQLPPVRNEWQLASLDLQYALRRQIAVGLRYQYERFLVDDFAFNPSTLDRIDLPSTLILGRLYEPYTAHTVWLRLRYLW